MFPCLVLSGQLDGGGKESGCGVFDPFVALLESFSGRLKESELGIVVRPLYQVDNPCEPALLYNGFIGLCASSLAWNTGISSWLLHTFADDDPHYLDSALKVFHGGNFGLITQDASGDFASHCSSCWVCLSMEKRDEVWESEGGE